MGQNRFRSTSEILVGQLLLFDVSVWIVWCLFCFFQFHAHVFFVVSLPCFFSRPPKNSCNKGIGINQPMCLWDSYSRGLVRFEAFGQGFTSSSEAWTLTPKKTGISLDKAQVFAIFIKVVVTLFYLFTGMIASQADTPECGKLFADETPTASAWFLWVIQMLLLICGGFYKGLKMLEMENPASLHTWHCYWNTMECGHSGFHLARRRL